MAYIILVYSLLMVGLVAAAIYVAISSSNLSLPISLETTLLTILLPIIAATNIYITPVLQRISQQAQSPAAVFLVPAALQVLQGILTVVLATLSFEGFLPGRNLNCNLQDAWKQLWRASDGRSIERIQDTFNCCGLNSVRHMSWPRHDGRTDLCSQLYHRSSSCIGSWTGAMQRNSGLDFGVAVAVGIFQLIHVALFGLRNSSAKSKGRYKPLPQSASAGGTNDRSSNPSEEDDSSQIQGYGALDSDANPRVEPSGLGNENGPWQVSL